MAWVSMLWPRQRTSTPIPAASMTAWPLILDLAWLDQGVWLLGNWPEGWADVKDRAYLLDLATFDPVVFPLTRPDETMSG